MRRLLCVDLQRQHRSCFPITVLYTCGDYSTDAARDSLRSFHTFVIMIQTLKLSFTHLALNLNQPKYQRFFLNIYKPVLKARIKNSTRLFPSVDKSGSLLTVRSLFLFYIYMYIFIIQTLVRMRKKINTGYFSSLFQTEPVHGQTFSSLYSTNKLAGDTGIVHHLARLDSQKHFEKDEREKT